MSATTLVAAVMIAAGVLGVIVPVLPGLALVWGGVAVWAFGRQDAAAWATLGVATALVAAGTLLKYAWPGRRLRASGVPWTSLAAGAALGIVGFFVVPVVGLLAGFVLGVYLAELTRVTRAGGAHAEAWPSTRRALAAVGWSMLIELFTALLVAAGWLAVAVL